MNNGCLETHAPIDISEGEAETEEGMQDRVEELQAHVARSPPALCQEILCLFVRRELNEGF